MVQGTDCLKFYSDGNLILKNDIWQFDKWFESIFFLTVSAN